MKDKYLKDPKTGSVYAFSGDGSQDEFIPQGLIKMSDAEVDAHLNPVQTAAQVLESRRAAYSAESDHLKIAAEFDAIKSETDPDYSAWISKVEEIKERFPLPRG